MPDPCAISEATEILNSKQNDSNVSDIMGLVVGLSLFQSPRATSLQKVDVWISDASVASDVRVRVTLYGSTEVARVVQAQVAVGDILRFNKISLNKINSEQFVEFAYPREGAGPGSEWFRLARIDVDHVWINEVSTHRVPEDMVTSDDRLNQLVQWSQKNRNGVDKSSLPPLPCRRRDLSEIQSSIGLLSNVKVQVTHYECQRIAQSPTMRKRKRPGSTMSIGFASLTDRSGGVMSFVDTANRFEKVLQDINDSGKLVMLTNLSSTNQNDIDKRVFRSDEVVLVPTNNSVAILLDETQLSDSHDSPALFADGTESSFSRRNEVSLVSSVRDISMGGVSIISIMNRRSLDSVPAFLEAILTPEGGYRWAEIQLEFIYFGQIEHAILTRPEIVQTLFGGIEAFELNGDSTLTLHVSRLVFALMIERVQLRWTIDTSGEVPNITSVVLPTLSFD
jgi:hypothetical protein